MIVQVSGETLLIFVGIPALIIAVVWLLVFAPSIAKGPRYRPGLSWWAPPVWVGGPSPVKELTAGDPDPNPAPVVKSTGGASASW